MFCKNCGAEMNEGAAVCVSCGTEKGKGNGYCPVCGKETNPDAAVCLNCSSSLEKKTDEKAKSKLAAGLLGIFLGALGVHNFYLGYTVKAVIQLLLSTLGVCIIVGPIISEVWGFVEGILILTGKINTDGKGNPLKD